MTIATPRTRARRARVNRGSEARIKRNVASSLPLFHSPWNCGGDFLEIEGDAVRLVRLGRGLDQPRPTRELANQRDLGRVGKPVERRLAQAPQSVKSSSGNCSAACRMTEAARAWAYWT